MNKKMRSYCAAATFFVGVYAQADCSGSYGLHSEYRSLPRHIAPHIGPAIMGRYGCGMSYGWYAETFVSLPLARNDKDEFDVVLGYARGKGLNVRNIYLGHTRLTRGESISRFGISWRYGMLSMQYESYNDSIFGDGHSMAFGLQRDRWTLHAISSSEVVGKDAMHIAFSRTFRVPHAPQWQGAVHGFLFDQKTHNENRVRANIALSFTRRF